MKPIVIIGGGLAGYSVARELRKLDRTTPLVMLMADDGGFYSKPMLSNAWAQQKTAASLLLYSATEMAQQLQADIRPQTEVLALDTAAHTLRVRGPEGEGDLAYGRLVLALGADPIRLPLVGEGAEAVLSVNDRQDYARFRDAVSGRRHVALLGAGLIGCEFADDLAGAGFQVSVFDPSPQPLGRLLPTQAGRYLADALAGRGITWHLGDSVAEIRRDGHDGGVLRLRSSQGMEESPDVVLSAVGLRPRIALAQAAGLALGRGIKVDRYLRSSAPDVFALGDCAEVEGLLLPFVLPLMAGARAMASTLAGTERAVSYPAMPVVVKTPSCPTVVCPPPMGAAGVWEEHATAAGVRALYRNEAGQLLGFALLGEAVAEKQVLAAQVPAWL